MASPKVLQSGSAYEAADLDGDGIVTDAELERHERLVRFENEDKQVDAQRNMAWLLCLVCCYTLLLYY